MADANLDPAAPERFFAVMRPRLHRYCARMVGSAFDGEDVVQDALAKAATALREPGGADALACPESWLFRIAHNAALDALRRRKREAARTADADVSEIADSNEAADARVAAAASLATFLRLPATQRASVVLIDVLGHSAEETAGILNVGVPAVKAALHRARARLKSFGDTQGSPAPVLAPGERERLRAYADTFNARDFDALRALLAEDVRLDLVDRVRLAGRKEVSVYFTRYSESSDWRFTPGFVEGRAALLVSNPADSAGAVVYVVLLDWTGERIAAIRDFRYAPYIMESLAVRPL